MLRVDDKGDVRFARLSYRGKTTQLRLPLLIWKLEAGDRRQLELMRQYLGALERKFEKEHGFAARKSDE